MCRLTLLFLRNTYRVYLTLPPHRHHPDHSICMATAIENLVRTRRAAGTTARSRCAPSAPGRATGTSPRARRGRARRRSRGGRRRRRRATR
jgi:hypothetical protein